MLRILALIFVVAAGPVLARSADTIFDGDKKAPPQTLSEFLHANGVTSPETPDATALSGRYWMTVEAASASDRTRISTIGMSIEEVGEGTVSGEADQEIIGRLVREGFKIKDKISLRRIRPEDFPEQDGAYHNYAEVQSELNAIAQAHPDIIRAFSIGTSVEGRSLTALRFHAAAGKSTKPGVAFLGTHHAREHLSTEVPLLLARWLAENAARPDIKKLLDERDIYFIPLVNPDGVEYDIETGSYKWQRKNMRKNANGSIGVDLNRNYDWGWGGEGASSNPNASTYHGPAPFSEPESQAVRDFLTSRKNIRIVVSYHTFSELILYPWGGKNEPISNGRALGAFKAMAEKMAAWTGYRPMQSSALYVATGDTCDWAWGKLNMFCFTFELTPKSSWQGGFYPGADVVADTFKKNIEPALYLIELADDPYRAERKS